MTQLDICIYISSYKYSRNQRLFIAEDTESYLIRFIRRSVSKNYDLSKRQKIFVNVRWIVIFGSFGSEGKKKNILTQSIIFIFIQPICWIQKSVILILFLPNLNDTQFWTLIITFLINHNRFPLNMIEIVLWSSRNLQKKEKEAEWKTIRKKKLPKVRTPITNAVGHCPRISMFHNLDYPCWIRASDSRSRSLPFPRAKENETGRRGRFHRRGEGETLTELLSSILDGERKRSGNHARNTRNISSRSSICGES